MLIATILSLVLHVQAGESLNAALETARAVYAARGEKTTIRIEPGTYREELTVDVPGLKLINASRKPSIGLKNHGVDCDENAVRITWYYGHGYQYKSMNNRINYHSSNKRSYNATILNTEHNYKAEKIIITNTYKLL